MTSAKLCPWKTYRTSILNILYKTHYCWIIFDLTLLNMQNGILGTQFFYIPTVVERHPMGILKKSRKDVRSWNSLRIPILSIVSLSCKYIFIALFSMLPHQMCTKKTKELPVSQSHLFQENVSKVSYKDSKVTFRVQNSQDIPRTSILNISAQCFFFW